MSSMFWISVYIVLYLVISLMVIITYLIYHEHYMYRKSWPLPASYKEMISVSNKQDHEMNDEEFNLKYAGFRHEVGRMSTLPQTVLKRLNIILHYIELYAFNGGPSRLKAKYPIISPIFIIGDFRSGTSVLERLIAHHPDITYWTMAHGILFAAPYLWVKLLGLMEIIRTKIWKHPSWCGPNTKGVYWPHSSNRLLDRAKPFEIELLWMSCKYNLKYKRFHDWNNLDDIHKNPDNNGNLDILDDTLSDESFENLFKNSIRMLLASNNVSKTPKFILKNPLNGYRIGYLYKLFPDAQFIHIARNPLKTALSQVRMGQSSLRCFFLNDKECRINPKHTSPIFNNKNPNDESGMLWFPRQFPRTKPEYHQITKYLKNDKYECAVATAVCQFERTVLDSFKKYNISSSNKNLLTIWHEDILENAEFEFEKIMKYLNLKCTKQQRLEWLEAEDFPGGQANKKRVKKSNETEKNINFGKHTKEVSTIIQNSDVMKQYKQRNS